MLFGGAERVDLHRIQSMGLLAVKIAQMYAVRADFLGVETCRKLQGLYEEAKALPWEEFEKIYLAGVTVAGKEAIIEIEKDCLAAASLGQVHRAKLKDGSAVVVKVVKAAPLDELQEDLKAMRLLVECALFFYPRLARLADPRGTLETIERLTVHEMNLLNEVAGTARLRELRDEGAKDREILRRLDFPKIYESLSSQAVLVVEEVREPSVRRRLDSCDFGYEDVLALFQTQGYFVFERGEFHGDLHPGNVYGDAEGFRMIDNANVEKVDQVFSEGLLRFLNCLGKKDYRKAGEVLESLAEEPFADNEVFLKAFETLYKGFGGRPIGEQSLTNQMMKTVRFAVESGLEFPEGAFPVIKALMYLDGVALRCAPEKTLLNDVMEFAGVSGTS